MSHTVALDVSEYSYRGFAVKPGAIHGGIRQWMISGPVYVWDPETEKDVLLQGLVFRSWRELMEAIDSRLRRNVVEPMVDEAM